MNRRQFLAVATTGTGLIAGCSDFNRTNNGGSSTYTNQAYIRENSPLETGGIDLGAIYEIIPRENWDCIDGRPDQGVYDSTRDGAVVNRQIDLLRGFGVDRIQFRFTRPEHHGSIKQFNEASLAQSIQYEITYDLKEAVEAGWDLNGDLVSLRDRFADGNYSTLRGRPVLTLGDFVQFVQHDEQARTLRSGLPTGAGDVPGFLAHVRSVLATGGMEPFLIADMGRIMSEEGASKIGEQHAEAFVYLDAVTNRALVTEGGTLPWADAFQRTSMTYRSLSQLGEDFDLDVVPTVYPGLDRTIDRCDDHAERIPRSPAHLRAILAHAYSYASIDRLAIDSFNDWRYGTQIEPGTVQDETYGLAYLREVREFVQQWLAADALSRRVFFVAPDGSDKDVGSKERPLRTIQEGIHRAGPGDTVQVRRGEYREHLQTVRSGKPEAPITIRGPTDAVVRNSGSFLTVEVRHSHVHWRGLTVDGLNNPDAPDDIESYGGLIFCQPPLHSKKYLRDLVIRPNQLGNSPGTFVTLIRCVGVDVGTFRVIGPAGLTYQLTDQPGHAGELVYIGTAIGNTYKDWYPWDGLDQTREVRVHHIDNSAGFPHAELVDAKPGTTDVTIEYCTDMGGAGSYLLPDHKPSSEAAISLQGRDSILRWCVIENSHGQAVEIGASYLTHPDGPPHEIPDGAMDEGRGHSVYGNRLVNNGGLAIEYRTTDEGDIPERYGPEAQRYVCGNTYNGETHGNPGKPCPEEVPETDQIGHLGGDSPRN